ncbi:MAG: winged helix-turn-helix domain-containing protein [Clostridiales bacterium]|nr:winged helix-turn-helix domain-containing protein [Clostridiales bacterium]
MGDKRKRAILNYLTEHGESSPSDISDHIRLGSDRTRVYLKELIAAGVVVDKGGNRNRTYLLRRRK